MKFGVREGMLKVSYETVLEEAGSLGFDGVELEVGPKVPDEGSPLFDADERKRLVDRIERSDVAVSCVCIGAFWKYSPAESDKELRDVGLQLLKTSPLVIQLSQQRISSDHALIGWCICPCFYNLIYLILKIYFPLLS